MIAKEKLALTRRELQEIVILTSKLTTQLGRILTSKGDRLFSSFGITYIDRQSMDKSSETDDKKNIIG